MKITAQYIAERTGLSEPSVRRHIIAAAKEAGKRNFKYSKSANLNGLSIASVERIVARSKNENSCNAATELLREIQTNSVKPIRTIQRNNSAKPVNESSETSAMKPVKLSTQFTLPIECNSVAASSLIDVTLDLVETVAVKKIESKPFDFGNTVLSNPNVRFLFVVAMVTGQAYMFAMLEQKVMQGTTFQIHIGFAIAIGVLFEAVGFMIARSIEVSRLLGEYPIRNLWLGGFFTFQCITNLCLIQPLSASGLAIIVGRIIISIAIPIGLAAYSFLYFKD